MAAALLNRFVLRRYFVEAMPKTVGTISDGRACAVWTAESEVVAMPIVAGVGTPANRHGIRARLYLCNLCGVVDFYGDGITVAEVPTCSASVNSHPFDSDARDM
jgi:hypothetical protein